MSAERILPGNSRIQHYTQQQGNNRTTRKKSIKLIDAIAYTVDFSDESHRLAQTHGVLISLINNMDDKEVAQKVCQYKNSFIDIDDAVAESIMFDML